MFRSKSLFTFTGGCVLAAAAVLQAPAAGAIPINLTSITGNWTAATPAEVAGVGTNTISWGVAATASGQSSYVFDPAATPINGLLPNDPFQLGTFTHNNFPIRAPFLTTAELTVIIGFDVLDGATVVDSRTISSVFDFLHEETPNGANPCADGNPQGPPNQNGCADRVTFESSANTEFFSVNGIDYTFNLTGFAQPPSTDTVNEFWTVESQTNSAVLFAEYAVRETPPNTVPLPHAAWLVVIGLAGLGWNRRNG